MYYFILDLTPGALILKYCTISGKWKSHSSACLTLGSTDDDTTDDDTNGTRSSLSILKLLCLTVLGDRNCSVHVCNFSYVLPENHSLCEHFISRAGSREFCLVGLMWDDTHVSRSIIMRIFLNMLIYSHTIALSPTFTWHQFDTLESSIETEVQLELSRAHIYPAR